MSPSQGAGSVFGDLTLSLCLLDDRLLRVAGSKPCSRDQVNRRPTGLHRGTHEEVDSRSTPRRALRRRGLVSRKARARPPSVISLVWRILGSSRRMVVSTVRWCQGPMWTASNTRYWRPQAGLQTRFGSDSIDFLSMVITVMTSCLLGSGNVTTKIQRRVWLRTKRASIWTIAVHWWTSRLDGDGPGVRQRLRRTCVVHGGAFSRRSWYWKCSCIPTVCASTTPAGAGWWPLVWRTRLSSHISFSSVEGPLQKTSEPDDPEGDSRRVFATRAIRSRLAWRTWRALLELYTFASTCCRAAAILAGGAVSSVVSMALNVQTESITRSAV